MTENSVQNPMAMVAEYWQTVVFRRWWVVFGTVAISLVAITMIALLPNYYEATTTILVDPQKIPDKYVSSTVTGDPAQRLNTISQEVLSATRLQQIVDQFHLYAGSKLAREEIIDRMRNDIKIEVKEGGGGTLGSFAITYTGRDPALVAQVTNQLAGSFIEWNLKSREQFVLGTTDFLKSELEDARQKLVEQEDKVSHFKIEHPGEMPDEQTGNMQMLTQLQTMLQANRDALNRKDIERNAALQGVTVSTEPGVTAAPLTERQKLLGEQQQLEARVAELLKRYTPAFPEVVATNRQLEGVRNRLKQLPPDDAPKPVPVHTPVASNTYQVSVIDRDIKRLTDEQTHLVEQINQYRAKLGAAPVRAQQITDLTRNYQALSQNYMQLLDKTFSADLAAELERRQKAERFIPLDPAQVPEKPVKPKRKAMILGSILAALAASIGGAIGWELLGTTINSRSQLLKIVSKEALLLATIPTIDTPEVSKTRRLWLIAGFALSTLAFAAEVLFWIKVKPIL